jgi:MFS family permease
MGVIMSVPGQTMGVSVFTDSLISALGLTRDQLSTAYMFGTVGSAFLMPFAGRMYDRLGSRVMAVVASVCLAGALVILSVSDRVAQLVSLSSGLAGAAAGFGVVVLAFLALRFWGQGVLTLTSNNMVSKWFHRYRGFANGITGILTALGFSIAPLLLDGLIGQYGWRGAWLLMAAILTFIFAPLALALFRDNPEECGLEPDGRSDVTEDTSRSLSIPEPCWTLAQARRTWAFWVFSLSLALFAMFITGFTFHVVSVFEEAGMTRSQAVVIFLPTSVVAVIMRFASGWLSDRIALKWLLALMLVGMAGAMVGVSYLNPGWPVVVLVAGNGISSGIFGLLSAVTWANFFGRRHLGSISGLNMSMVVFGSAIGPVLFSQSLTLTGYYGTAGWVSLLLAALLLAAALRVEQPPHEPA